MPPRVPGPGTYYLHREGLQGSSLAGGRSQGAEVFHKCLSKSGNEVFPGLRSGEIPRKNSGVHCGSGGLRVLRVAVALEHISPIIEYYENCRRQTLRD
jgi:hypothetical protein